MEDNRNTSDPTGVTALVTDVSQEQSLQPEGGIPGLILPDEYAVPRHGVLYHQGRYVRILWRDKNRKMRWKSLHRDIWEWAYGPIPPNHVVHHVNGNALDNTLENLECLPKPEHSRLHAEHPELASPEGAALYLKYRETSRKCCREYYQRKKQNRTRDGSQNEPE